MYVRKISLQPFNKRAMALWTCGSEVKTLLEFKPVLRFEISLEEEVSYDPLT